MVHVSLSANAMALATEEALMVVRSHYRVCKDMCAPETPKETAATLRRSEMSVEVRVPTCGRCLSVCRTKRLSIVLLFPLGYGLIGGG